MILLKNNIQKPKKHSNTETFKHRNIQTQKQTSTEEIQKKTIVQKIRREMEKSKTNKQNNHLS